MSKTTQTPPTKDDLLKAVNEAVMAAYFAILADIKAVLPQYPTEYLRTYCEVDYTSLGLKCRYGFFSPLIHLQLENEGGFLQISFSRNLTKQQVSNRLDGLLSRIVYKNTAEEITSILIEDNVTCIPYNMDDFRQANNLISKGFKDGKKVTV